MHPAGEPATIVVVDSTHAFLELAEGVLRDAGHRVLVTSDMLEALTLARTVRVDLLVGASALIDSVRCYPDLPDLLEIVDGAEESNGQLRLRRPFALAQLRDAVALALEPIED